MEVISEPSKSNLDIIVVGGTDDAGEWLDKDKDSFANDFPTARLILCRWRRGQSDENDDVGRDLLDLRLGMFHQFNPIIFFVYSSGYSAFEKAIGYFEKRGLPLQSHIFGVAFIPETDEEIPLCAFPLLQNKFKIFSGTRRQHDSATIRQPIIMTGIICNNLTLNETTGSKYRQIRSSFLQWAREVNSPQQAASERPYPTFGGIQFNGTISGTNVYHNIRIPPGSNINLTFK
ncbi:Hypothetical protein PENO1_112030 [Penicillium occitanis (nom. inval.)]|nr:Hypothetical protein PENO1_112030 [Penicillium occitanis (nom. inval.)]PCG88135.1 hypothetical protein PENOC_112310 [Penicillium occitanis (nom. inval.)]